MKKTLLLCLLLALTGCQAGHDIQPVRNNEEDIQPVQADDDRAYLEHAYGLTEEETEGLDAERFIEDYGLMEEDYSPEEVRQILEEERDAYIDDGSHVYDILDLDTGRICGCQPVSLIAFSYNEGTLYEKMVIDTDQEIFYRNDGQEHLLDPEDAARLRDIMSLFGLDKWDSVYEGEEGPSTGSLAWKLVLITEDGQGAVYEGNTGDMSHLPDNFSQLSEYLRGLR